MWGQRGRTVKDHHANITPAPPNPSLDGLPRVRAIKTNYDTTNEANHPAIPADRLPSLSAPLRQGFTGLRVEVYTTPGVLPYPGGRSEAGSCREGGPGGPQNYITSAGSGMHAALTLMHPGGHNHGDWLPAPP